MTETDRLLSVKRRLLEIGRRADAIDSMIARADQARDLIIDVIRDVEAVPGEHRLDRNALWHSLPDLERALRILRRERGNCNRAIANVARAKRGGGS